MTVVPHDTIVPFKSGIGHVVIDSVRELIRQQTSINTPLWRVTQDADVLFGIVDMDGFTAEEYKQIGAEMQRFGNRKVGAVTVCVKKNSVQEPLATGDFGHNGNILRKIKCMLAKERNFDIQVQPFKNADYAGDLGDHPMVVGAHLACPGPNSTEFCPSVAAVVGSVAGNPVFYPGSARVQPHITTISDVDGPERKVVLESQILYLQNMMKERFEAWRSKNGTQHPTSVIVYRDGMGAGEPNKEICGREIDDIKKAFYEVFPKNHSVVLKLAYIICGKNTMITKRPSQDLQNFEKKDTKPTFTFTTSKEEPRQIARYQYRVICNDIRLTPEEFADMVSFLSLHFSQSQLTRQQTAKLNLTSQLAHQVSLALPVHYAQKLSRRMFDYFRWLARRDLSDVPPYARLTEAKSYKSAGGNGKKMAKHVHEYIIKDTTKEGEKPTLGIDPNWENRTVPWRSKLDDTMFYL
jgi:hypothetical protein